MLDAFYKTDEIMFIVQINRNCQFHNSISSKDNTVLVIDQIFVLSNIQPQTLAHSQNVFVNCSFFGNYRSGSLQWQNESPEGQWTTFLLVH